MQRLNDSWDFIGRHFVPDMYLFDSVGDFVQNRDRIVRPPRISFKNSLIELGYPGEVLLLFENVNIGSSGDYTQTISDLTSEFEANKILNFPSRRSLRSLSLEYIENNPGRYSQVTFLHNPRTGSIDMYEAKRADGEKRREEVPFLGRLGLSFSS